MQALDPLLTTEYEYVRFRTSEQLIVSLLMQFAAGTALHREGPGDLYCTSTYSA